MKIGKFFYFPESRDTGLLVHVNLKKMVLKLTVLVGLQSQNKKTYFKVRWGTNGF